MRAGVQRRAAARGRSLGREQTLVWCSCAQMRPRTQRAATCGSVTMCVRVRASARPRFGSSVRRALGTGRAWRACVGERMTWQERCRTTHLKARPAFRALCFEVRATCATWEGTPSWPRAGKPDPRRTGHSCGEMHSAACAPRTSRGSTGTACAGLSTFAAHSRCAIGQIRTPQAGAARGKTSSISTSPCSISSIRAGCAAKFRDACRTCISSCSITMRRASVL